MIIKTKKGKERMERTTKYEIVTSKGTEIKDLTKLLLDVKKVCDKVEKVQDTYKSIAEAVYTVHKYQPWKSSESNCKNFTDYMRVMTGMGKTTAKSLVAIWKKRNEIEDILTGETEDLALIKANLTAFDGLSMRELLYFVSKVDTVQFLNCVDEKRDKEDSLLSEMGDIYKEVIAEWHDSEALEDKNIVDGKAEEVKESKNQEPDSENNQEPDSENNQESDEDSRTFTPRDGEELNALIKFIEGCYDNHKDSVSITVKW